MLATNGNRIYESTTNQTVPIVGVNDTMLAGYAKYYQVGYFAQYKDMNYNYPTNYDNPQIYPEFSPTIDVWNNIRPTMASSSTREFLWKYFWLNGNYLHLNCVRLNGGSNSISDELRSWWTSNRTQFMMFMKDVFDMAYANGVYVIFTFIGGFYSGTIDPNTTDHVYVPGSPTYNLVMNWIKDIVLTFKDHPGVGMWDLINEPATTTGWTYWKAKGGGTVDGGRAALKTYMERLCSDVIAINHSHPITCGTGCGGEEAPYADISVISPSNSDVWQTHLYFSSELPAHANVRGPHATAIANNKAMLIGECGYNKTTVYHPPYSYWKYIYVNSIANENTGYVDGVCWMTLNEMRLDQGAYSAQEAYSWPINTPTAFYPIPHSVYDTIPPKPYEGPMAVMLGSQIYSDGQPLRLNIVNDTIVMNWAQAQAWGGYPTYKYSNVNFPGIFTIPGGEVDSEIPNCNNYREFFWKYFWLLRYKLGTTATGIHIDCNNADGCSSADPTYYNKIKSHNSTNMNGVRFGPHNDWARNFQVRCFYNYRAYCDQLMNDLYDMAEANNCYIVYTMGGGVGSDDSIFGGTGYVSTKSADPNSNFQKYIKYCYEFINAYGNRKADAMFDVYNEPQTEGILYGYGLGWGGTDSGGWSHASCVSVSAPYLITPTTGTFPDIPVGGIISVFSNSSPPQAYWVSSVVKDGGGNIIQVVSNSMAAGTHAPFSDQYFYRWNGWWVKTYPTYVRNGTTYYLRSAADESYLDWAKALVDGIKAGITLNPKPLITIGNGSGPGGSQANTEHWSEAIDVMNGHPYGSAEDGRFGNVKTWAKNIGKPMFFEEYGYNGTNHSPWQSYWQFFDMMCDYEGHNAGAMQFNGSFHTPDWAYAYDKPPYPGASYHNGSEDGYCPGDCFMTQAELDAFFAGIPPMPTPPVITRKSSPTGSAYGGVSFY